MGQQVELSSECECSDCGAKFIWREAPGKISSKELEELRCPECGEQNLLFEAKRMD